MWPEIQNTPERVVERFSPEADHLSDHRAILFQLPTSADSQLTSTSIAKSFYHRMILQTLVNEIYEKGFHGRTIIADPAKTFEEGPRLTHIHLSLVYQWVETALEGNNHHFRSNRQQGSISLVPLPAKDAIHPYIRDEYLLGTANGKPALIASAVMAKLQGRKPNAMFRRMEALSQTIGTTPYFIEPYIEGGNIIPTKDYLLVGRESVDKARLVKQTLENKEIGAKQASALLEKCLTSDSGRQMIIIDGDPDNIEQDQQVYHLDLSFMMATDPQGREVALLSSMRYAKEILEAHQLLPQKGRSVKNSSWLEAMSYPEMDAQVSRQLSIQATQQLTHPSNIHAQQIRQLSSSPQEFGSELRKTRKSFENLYNDPLNSLRIVGKSLIQFFTEENYSQVQGYLDQIGAKLANLGLEVVEVPSLLIATDNIQDYESSLVPKIPIYAPANGIQFNDATAGPSVMNVGFMRLFDQEVTSILGRYRLKHVPLVRAAPYAQELAGFHCIGLTIPQAITPPPKRS